MLEDAGYEILEVFDLLVPLLVGVALIVFVWGVVKFIAASGDDKAYEEGRRRMLWGVIILFVIISMWGLVRLARTILGVRTGFVDAPYVEYSADVGGGGGGGASCANASAPCPDGSGWSCASPCCPYSGLDPSLCMNVGN